MESIVLKIRREGIDLYPKAMVVECSIGLLKPFPSLAWTLALVFSFNKIKPFRTYILLLILLTRPWDTKSRTNHFSVGII